MIRQTMIWNLSQLYLALLIGHWDSFTVNLGCEGTGLGIGCIFLGQDWQMG